MSLKSSRARNTLFILVVNSLSVVDTIARHKGAIYNIIIFADRRCWFARSQKCVKLQSFKFDIIHFLFRFYSKISRRNFRRENQKQRPCAKADRDDREHKSRRFQTWTNSNYFRCRTSATTMLRTTIRLLSRVTWYNIIYYYTPRDVFKFFLIYFDVQITSIILHSDSILPELHFKSPPLNNSDPY